MTFGVRKFLTLLPVGVFTAALWCVVMTVSTAVAGNFIGPDALSALNLVVPVFNGTTFLIELIAVGATIMFSIEIGRANTRRAHERFSGGLLTMLAFGVAGAAAVAFGSGLYLSFYGVTPEVAAQAAAYLKWFAPVPLASGVMLYLQMMLMAEGDIRRSLLSFAVFFVVDILVTIGGVSAGMGIAACSSALVFASIAASCVLVTHFFSSKNTIRFVGVWRFSDVREMLACSFGDTAVNLCTALLMVFLTKFTITVFGPDKLLLLQLAVTIFGFYDVLDGIGQAAEPLLTVYYGEGNLPGLQRVIRGATLLSIGGAGVIILFVMIFPEVIGQMFGLTDPAIRADVAHVARLAAFSLLPLSVAGLYNSYYTCIERPMLAVLISFSVFLVFPIVAFSTGSLLGIDGFWFGFTAGPVLGIVFFSLFLIATHGFSRFPLLINRWRAKRIQSFTLTLDESSVVDVSRRISFLLRRRPALAMRVSLLVEEALLVIRERNKGRKVLAEVTLERATEPRLILRDDGVIFDLTDADAQVSSLRGFVVASLMEKQLGRLNLITTGFNRNVFRCSPNKA